MVVKFMVKVRLMENSVKSQVGRVIVAKPITQNSRLGIVCRKNTSSCPKPPGIALSTGGGTAGSVRQAMSEEGGNPEEAEVATETVADDRLSGLRNDDAEEEGPDCIIADAIAAGLSLSLSPSASGDAMAIGPNARSMQAPALSLWPRRGEIAR